ncbi:MAG: hypothetical protein RLZZ312_678 [Bacteroidota bacterium]|jgi:hypothetical protein
MTKSEEQTILKKGVFTGIIEKDDKNNFFCGQILLDYQMVTKDFKLGDLITVKSVITNPSDISFKLYPTKSRNFAIANLKP